MVCKTRQARFRIFHFRIEHVHKLHNSFVSVQHISVTPKLIFENRCYSALMHPGGRPSQKPRSPLGQRITLARERAGISQVELAEKLGTNQQTIAYWERNASRLNSDVLAKLVEILKVSADELHGTKTPKESPSAPQGRARKAFEELATLPRRQQQKVLDVVEALIAQNRKVA
jgi:transcriptional regulator with XRE-family HTH domain